MQYSSIKFSRIDPALYHVYFSPSNNSDIVFEVMVQKNISLRTPTSDNKYIYVPDNYYIAYFEFELGEFFKNDVNKIWGDDANTRVLFPNPAMYAFGIPHGLNDQQSLEDMAALLETYSLVVTLNLDLNTDTQTNEAEKIFKFIKIVQGSDYAPNRISFWYKSSKTTESKNGQINIVFDDWMDISTVSQILEQLV